MIKFVKKILKKLTPTHKFPEKKLAVVIASYNNALWYKKNLDSIFSQKYSNYRIIYIDDASTDNTGQLVENYIKKMQQKHRFTLIKNKFNKGATANRYKGSHLCEDNEIVLILDGDDWFAHNRVMQTINKAYSVTDTWITYGQFMRWPSQEKGHCKRLPQSYDFRNMKHWYTSALRTYYAWLFKKIKKEDLLYNEKFFQTSGDVAEMLPMLEKARNHIQFVKEILYIYNTENPLNDFKLKAKEQQKTFTDIKNK